MSAFSPDGLYLLQNLSLCSVDLDDRDREKLFSCLPLVGMSGCPVAATMEALGNIADLKKPIGGDVLNSVVETNPLLMEQVVEFSTEPTFVCQRGDLIDLIGKNPLVAPEERDIASHAPGTITFRQIIIPI